MGSIELDSAPPEGEIPPALGAALNDGPVALAAFEAMPFSHRKEYARWVAEAKREETRDRRVAKALQMLREGTKLS